MKNKNAGTSDETSSSLPAVSETKRKRFAKPTIEEVRSYVQEKGYHIDAEAWYAHYEANGWMVGRHKMVDWRASVSYWERIEKKGKEKKTNYGNTSGQCDKNALFPYQPQWYGGDATSSFGDGSFGSV